MLKEYLKNKMRMVLDQIPEVKSLITHGNVYVPASSLVNPSTPTTFILNCRNQVFAEFHKSIGSPKSYFGIMSLKIKDAAGNPVSICINHKSCMSSVENRCQLSALAAYFDIETGVLHQDRAFLESLKTKEIDLINAYKFKNDHNQVYHLLAKIKFLEIGFGFKCSENLQTLLYKILNFSNEEEVKSCKTIKCESLLPKQKKGNRGPSLNAKVKKLQGTDFTYE